MIDFWRNWTKSTEEKRREAINAYLDDSLSSRQRAAFEAELAQDETLQAEMAQLRLVRENLRQLPRRRTPRNFTLDPALYGRPQREPLVQVYPVLRVATVLTAFFFVLAIALQTFTPGGLLAPTAEQVVEVTRVVTMSDEVAMEAAAEAPMEEVAPLAAAPMVEGEVIEVTRVVTEMVVETAVEEEVVAETAAEPAAEMAADEAETDAAEGVSMAPATEPVGTAVPITTTTPSPTATLLPTPSPTNTPDIPRLFSEEPATDRAGGELGGQNGLETAVLTPTPMPETSTATPFSAFSWLPIGLGALLALLAALTVAARRRLL